MTLPTPRKRVKPVKVPVAKASAIKHGRFIFIDYTRKKKQDAIDAYVADCFEIGTWKKLYAAGARTIPVWVSITPVKPRKKK